MRPLLPPQLPDGQGEMLLELAQKLLAAMGSPLSTQFGPERHVNKVPRRLADISRARDRLGFVAEIGLEPGLRGLVEWWQAERERPAGAKLSVVS